MGRFDGCKSAGDRWQRVVQNANQVILARYIAWIDQNPKVLDTFVQLSLQMLASGRKHYSHWNIVNRIRWDYDIATVGEEFKICNDFIAFLARHAMAMQPELEDFFELRELGTESSVPPSEAHYYRREPMSELFEASEAISLIAPAILRLGRVQAFVHSVQVLGKGIAILFAGVPKIKEPPAIAGLSSVLLNSSQNVEVPAGSLLMVRVGNDHFPIFDNTVMEGYRAMIQAKLDLVGIKSTAVVTNHTMDFQVLVAKDAVADGLVELNVSSELWREYDFGGRSYHIQNPVKVFYRPGGKTHRIVDADGKTHCCPAPGEFSCVIRWRAKDGQPAVAA